MIFVDILEMDGATVDAMRADPFWPVRLASASLAPRECRVEEGWVYAPGQFDAVAAPALLLAGSASPASLAEATRKAARAIPNTRIHVMVGQDHVAIRTDAELVARITREFVVS